MNVPLAPPIEVLFVDDDPDLLRGLENVLRPQRRQWRMRFEAHPEAALATVAERPPAVVVTDVGMPGLGGERFLRAVQQTAPSTARVVLSGQTDARATARLVRVAHQLLAKPIEPRQLVEVVQRVAATRVRLERPELAALVVGAGAVPAPPRVWAALDGLLSRPSCELPEVVAAVEAEPAVAAKVLQLANSAWFGLPQQVTSLRHAVALLGFEPLLAMVLAFETERLFGGEGRLVERVRERSQRAGLAVRRLLAPGPLLDVAFTATLVADVGELLLATRPPGAVPDPPHELVSAWLLSLWGLPPAAVEAVAAHHHAPVDQPPTSPVAAAWLALALAEQSFLPPETPRPEALTAYVRAHGLELVVEQLAVTLRRGEAR